MKKDIINNIFIHSNYHPKNFGGIELVVSVLLKIFSGRYSLTCFYGGGGNLISSPTEHVKYVSRRILFKVRGASLLIWGNFSFIAMSFKSRLVIFQEPYPTLWPAALFLRRILNKKLVVLIHANPVAPPCIMSLYDNLRSFVFSGSVCVTTSPNLLSQIQISRFSKSLVIPLCVPDQPYPLANELKLPKEYALYIGRLARYKGIEFMLESAKTCKDVEFVIAGDGPLSSLVSTFIKKNGLKNIQFINRFITESEKYAMISQSSFLIFPSISENEAFGLVQLEAMKCSKAIVNTWLNSGVNYVAPNGVCALTVSPKSSAELSEAVMTLWNDVQLTKKLGEDGLRRFHSLFREELFAKSWRSLIEECLGHDCGISHG